MDAAWKKIYQFSAKASYQSVGQGGVVLLSDRTRLFSCNGTADAFLRKLDGNRTLLDVVSLMAQEYAVAHETLAENMADFALMLEHKGIIKCL
jgi:hypothetical protein